MDNVVSKLRKYANDLAASERLLEELERDAQEHRTKVETANAQRDAVQGEIEGIQGKIAALEQEREQLKVAYAESLFDADQERTDAITARRDTLDSELRELQQALSDKHGMLADLDEPDVEEAARLSAKLGMLDFADGYTWASSIRQELVNHQLNLRTRVQAAQRGLPSGENARRKLDSKYAARKELEDSRLETLAQKVAANQELTEAGRENLAHPKDTRELDPRTGYLKGGARDRAYTAKTATI